MKIKVEAVRQNKYRRTRYGQWQLGITWLQRINSSGTTAFFDSLFLDLIWVSIRVSFLHGDPDKYRARVKETPDWEKPR